MKTTSLSVFLLVAGMSIATAQPWLASHSVATTNAPRSNLPSYWTSARTNAIGGRGFSSKAAVAPMPSRTNAFKSIVSSSVAERGAHHKIVRIVLAETNVDGSVFYRTNSYTELATGMHYQDTNGVWAESREEIELLPNGAGAVARYGQHKVIFPSDIYDGQIELQMPGGQWLRSRVLGLVYSDTEGRSVLLAETTNSVGELHGSNVVVYPEAFTGIRASLRLTYRKAGFEQDIILLEQPPAPEKFGLNPDRTRLQVLTEFFNPPPPGKREQTVPDSKGGTMTDELLDWDTLRMAVGKAFSLDPADRDGNPRNEAMAQDRRSGFLG